MTSAGVDQGVYLYAFIRPGSGDAVTRLRGVSGRPVEVLMVDSVGCVVSHVPMKEFGTDALVRNVEDLEWVGRTAREHDAVVQACARTTTTVPMRLATVYRDDESLQRRVHGLGDQLEQLLDRLDDRDEWGVKLLADIDEPEPVEVADHATSGAAYLRARRAAQHQRADVAQEMLADAQRVYELLSRESVAAHRHRPQDSRLSGAGRPMVLNASFLVDRRKLDRFQAAAAALAEGRAPGTVVVTGPWAPYSFVGLDEP